MGWLTELLQGIPLNAVLQERLALAEQKFKDIENENKRLKEEVAALTAENEKVKRQIAEAPVAAVPPVKFVTESGVLWKRDASGKFPPICYCPKCRQLMAVGDPLMNLSPRCRSCKIQAPFAKSELQAIATRLNTAG